MFGGPDGLAVIKPLISVAAGLLKVGGVLAIEHDDTQAESVPALLRARRVLDDVGDHADLTGRPRFVTATRVRMADRPAAPVEPVEPRNTPRQPPLRWQEEQRTIRLVTTFDCADPVARRAGLEAAAHAARSGNLVVMPTDTVYGIGADAFNAAAVRALLAAKGRGPDMPVPVLVGSWSTIDGLVTAVPPLARTLIEAFWPGGLSLVVEHAPSLRWDLGDAQGTVMIRMPLHPVALDLLRLVGPMAVSSANRSGQPGGDHRGGGHRSARRGRLGLPGRGRIADRRCLDRGGPHRRRAAGAARGRGEPRPAARSDRRGRAARLTERPE